MLAKQLQGLKNSLEMEEIDIKYASMQGGVLKPHGRNFSAILIFDWKRTVPLSERIRWLKELSWKVTTHKKQLEATERYIDAKKEGKEVQETFLTVGLGQAHFKKLGANIGSDEYWVNPNSSSDTNMYDLTTIGPLDNFDIKTLRTVAVLIAHDNEVRLKNEVTEIIKTLYRTKVHYNNSLAVHYGVRSGFYHPFSRTDEVGVSLDPFGFVDGVTDVKCKKSIAEIAFSDDLKTDEGKVFRGSYLALFKIQTDVDKFEKRVEAIAETVKSGEEINDNDIDYAKALLMGRYPNGESIMMLPREHGALTLEHSVAHFNNDKKGQRCPLGAHTRVVHTDQKKISEKVIRRSVPYYEWDPSKKVGDIRKRKIVKRGLFFMSFQGSLRKQFMPLIRKMVDMKDSIGYYRNSATPKRAPITYYDRRERKYTEIEVDNGELNFTLILGQQFFFFPEISFLREEG